MRYFPPSIFYLEEDGDHGDPKCSSCCCGTFQRWPKEGVSTSYIEDWAVFEGRKACQSRELWRLFVANTRFNPPSWDNGKKPCDNQDCPWYHQKKGRKGVLQTANEIRFFQTLQLSESSANLTPSERYLCDLQRLIALLEEWNNTLSLL